MDDAQAYVRMWVDDEPRPKARARTTIREGSVRTYTPVSTALSEWKIREVVSRTVAAPLEGALSVAIYIFLVPPQMPKKWQGVRRPTKRPDIDNYIKTALDACNHYAWKDDSQVVRLVAEKFYAWEEQRPGWEIQIRALEPRS